MKKSFAVMMLVLGTSLVGCATSGDLAKVQAQERVNAAKADQAVQDAQAARATADAAKSKADEANFRADAATLKADAAATRTENVVKMAEEREREKVADEKAARAEAAFQASMKK